jgi:hypothetical protein
MVTGVLCEILTRYVFIPVFFMIISFIFTLYYFSGDIKPDTQTLIRFYDNEETFHTYPGF